TLALDRPAIISLELNFPHIVKRAIRKSSDSEFSSRRPRRSDPGEDPPTPARRRESRFPRIAIADPVFY
ncbi:hypothetical protein, partial [uncultured Amaricoccus sp.]|uniref:hypothetical protein n=1 Tax=uncultured Amaricoccus sp. TaxID=339341 RepID=UPI002631CA11